MCMWHEAVAGVCSSPVSQGALHRTAMSHDYEAWSAGESVKLLPGRCIKWVKRAMSVNLVVFSHPNVPEKLGALQKAFAVTSRV